MLGEKEDREDREEGEDEEEEEEDGGLLGSRPNCRHRGLPTNDPHKPGQAAMRLNP